MEFHVSSQQRDDAVVITPVGDVDVATAPLFDAAINEAWAPPHALVIDCGAVPFMDSTGLGVLVKAAQRSSTDGGRVLLVAPSARVRKVLGITGIDTYIYVHDTLDEALRDTQSG